MARPIGPPRVRRRRGVAHVRFTHNGRTVERTLGKVDDAEALRLAAKYGDDPTLAPSERIGVIYFIEEVGTHRVKIGWSARPDTRLEQIQSMNAHELRLLAVKQCATLAEEKQLHRQFDDVHVRGEWFFLSKTLRHFIATMDEGADVSGPIAGRDILPLKSAPPKTRGVSQKP